MREAQLQQALAGSGGNSGPLSASQQRLVETHRNVSNFHRAKLTQTQTTAQSIARQRTPQSTTRGTPATNPAQGRLSVRTSARLGRQDSNDPEADSLTRNGSSTSRAAAQARAMRARGVSEDRDDLSRAVSNDAAERPRTNTTRSRISSSHHQIDVQPGQRVRIVIDGQGVWIDG